MTAPLSDDRAERRQNPMTDRNTATPLRPLQHTSFLALALVAVSAGTVILGVARADPASNDRPLPRSLRLEYERGPGAQRCPDAETIENVLGARIPRDRLDPAAPARLVVTISRQGIKYMATAEVFDAEGASVWTRPFTPLHSCDVLVMDIGIIVGERFRVPPPAPAPPAPSPPPSKPDVPSPPRERLATPAARLRVGGSLGLAIGTTPTKLSPIFPAVDGGGQLQLTPDWVLSGSLGARLILPASATVSGEPAEATTTQFVGVLAPCAHYRVFFGCMTFELGAFFASSSNMYTTGSQTSLWAAAGPRLGVEWPVPQVPQLALRFFGDLPVTINAVRLVARYQMEEELQLWKSPPVAGAMSLGFVYFF
jgi:hypothetical protein